MPKEQKYEAAMRQLEGIAAKMENGELDIDSLSEQLKIAQKLIKQCKDKLTKTDEDIRKILGSED
ncbi:exodeoxyribonuclease VII small subunit [Leyella stercorea]|uniref:exodeoxyribonuclease VII small subunit n=1 Tax=Leyella stercorea TaxID=363265 RepID=UPI00242D3BB0|nr:exodeoxyribonuclease VII small subunit [Leyella stercorea]